MPTLRELRKKLKSVRTSGQLAGAMRTSAAAKYSRLSAVSSAFAPFDSAVSDMYSLFSPEEEAKDGKPLFVLLSGSRGLCGGYHQELFLFFSSAVLKKEPDCAVITCGKKAAEYCRDKRIPVLGEFEVPDVPAFSDAERIAGRLFELYSSGGYSSVEFVHRRFFNMLKQVPCREVFLPFRAEKADDGAELLPIPDRETVGAELKSLALASSMYSALLSCASGVQAATVIAMRSAFDSAKHSADKLETEINRLRQAQVTMSVIETSSGFKE